MVSVVSDTLKSLMHSNNILSTDNVMLNTRNQIRVTSLVAIVNERYLVRLRATTHYTQLRKRTYEFSVLHLSKEQLLIVKQRQQFLLDHLITLKSRLLDIVTTAQITQEDKMDSYSIAKIADEWLAPHVNKSVFIKRKKAS